MTEHDHDDHAICYRSGMGVICSPTPASARRTRDIGDDEGRLAGDNFPKEQTVSKRRDALRSAVDKYYPDKDYLESLLDDRDLDDYECDEDDSDSDTHPWQAFDEANTRVKPRDLKKRPITAAERKAAEDYYKSHREILWSHLQVVYEPYDKDRDMPLDGYGDDENPHFVGYD